MNDELPDIAAHAKEGHIIEITSIPMRCITCDDISAELRAKIEDTPITDD